MIKPEHLPMRDHATGAFTDAQFFSLPTNTWVAKWEGPKRGYGRRMRLSFRVTDPTPSQLRAAKMPAEPIKGFRAVRIARISEMLSTSYHGGYFRGDGTLYVSAIVVQLPARKAGPLAWATNGEVEALHSKLQKAGVAAVEGGQIVLSRAISLTYSAGE